LILPLPATLINNKVIVNSFSSALVFPAVDAS